MSSSGLSKHQAIMDGWVWLKTLLIRDIFSHKTSNKYIKQGIVLNLLNLLNIPKSHTLSTNCVAHAQNIRNKGEIMTNNGR